MKNRKDKNKLSSKIELIANLLIIVVAVLFVTVLTRKIFFPPDNKSAQVQLTIGRKINLPVVDWSKQSKTLVLALRSDCRFCVESAPFYRRLLAAAQTANVKLIAVFPTAVEESAAHLDELGLQDIEVRRSPLGDLQVGGTPTLILVNDQGSVIDFWVGKLPADKEDEVINKLNSK